MDEPEARVSWVVFMPVVIGLGLALLTTLQAFALAALTGVSSSAFAMRAMAACMIWQSDAAMVLALVPLLAVDRTALLFWARVAAAAATAVALGVLLWLVLSGALSAVFLAISCGIAVVGWVATFLIERLRLRDIATA